MEEPVSSKGGKRADGLQIKKILIIGYIWSFGRGFLGQ